MPIRLTPAVKVLLFSCVGLFVIQQTVDQFFGGGIGAFFALVPYGFVVQFKFWQIFTYAFLHADITHLLLNMLMLVFIGGELEAFWGTKFFLKYYFVCSISSGVVYLFFQLLVSGSAHVPMVGASAAIYGLLVAYGIKFSERTLLFFMLFPMKAKYFVWILGGVEFFTTVFSGPTRLSGLAHLTGMFAGFSYLWLRAIKSLKQKRSEQRLKAPVKQKNSSHLKLVIDNKKNKNEPPVWH